MFSQFSNQPGADAEIVEVAPCDPISDVPMTGARKSNMIQKIPSDDEALAVA
jgi:hypothetical protein